MSIYNCWVAKLRDVMSVIGGDGCRPKSLVHESLSNSLTIKPVSSGGGARAIASAGYQRRCRATWSEEMDLSNEICKSEICLEITTDSLRRARLSTKGCQSLWPLSHVATQGGFRSSSPWSSNQLTSSLAQGDMVEYQKDQICEWVLKSSRTSIGIRGSIDEEKRCKRLCQEGEEVGT